MQEVHWTSEESVAKGLHQYAVTFFNFMFLLHR